MRVAVLVPLVAAACATSEARHRDWSSYTGPGAEEFRREELELPLARDPAEPVNRVLDGAKHAAAEYVVAPLGAGWRFVVPEAVREALTNVGENLLFPVRLVGNLAQGEWSAAGTETGRFAVNTTAGVLGITDAAECLGMPAPREQDTGRAFHRWGWKDSAYTALPAATVRDDVGFVADTLLDPLTYLPPAGWVRRLNDLSDRVDTYVEFTRTTYDPYRLERMVRLLDRELEPTDVEFAAAVGGGVDTLQYVFLGVLDPAFPDRCLDRTVRVEATGRDLSYRVWLQDRAAPVVYVLPGTGGHLGSGSTAALAEVAWNAGCHAVAVSSALSFDFIEEAGTSDFPGFAPSDARDVHVALTAIDADLRRRDGGRIAGGRAVLGMSLGGMHALLLAASEEEGRAEGLVPFDGYLALNPPVNLVHAARGMDAYYNLPLTLLPDRDDREKTVRALFRHVIDVAGSDDLRPGTPLPLNDAQARFLVGIAFRMTLLDILDQARALGRAEGRFLTPRSSLDRGASYVELADTSFLEYLYAFVLPEQAARPGTGLTNDDEGARLLERLCDLRSVADRLQANQRVRVVTNRNDLLLADEDVRFLEATFGSRLEMSDDGGHLGNLWRRDVRERLTGTVRSFFPQE